jgi:hypothetical protein
MKFCYLDDFAEMKADTRGVILGQEHLDVEGVFAALANVHFPADSCLSLEYEENEKDPLTDVPRDLQVEWPFAAGVARPPSEHSRLPLPRSQFYEILAQYSSTTALTIRT